MQPSSSTIPKAFQRVTGAHGVIVQLVGADLVGVACWALAGAIVGPPLWYVVRAMVLLLHDSLLADLWFLLVLVCIAAGRYRRRSLHKSSDEAWGVVTLVIIASVAAVVMIWLLHAAWLRIPAASIPAIHLETVTWRLVLIPQGAEIAVGLALLTHLFLLRRARHDPDVAQLTLSRAHPDGPIWQIAEHAYRIYRRDLARFSPSPIARLRTPDTFSYYQRQATSTSKEPANPEHEFFWHNGTLVINRAYIGPKEEQATILLPLLARLLYDCNTSNRTVEYLFHLAHLAEQIWWISWALRLPIAVAQRCKRQWDLMARERVLERDWFAYVLGQGKQLRKWLRLQLQDRTDNNLPDNEIPTLAERIDHLDSLLNREERQVVKLRDSLSSPPA